jgi:hypothetical protein
MGVYSTSYPIISTVFAALFTRPVIFEIITHSSLCEKKSCKNKGAALKK